MRSVDKRYLFYILFIIPGILWCATFYIAFMSSIIEDLPFLKPCIILALISTSLAILIYIVIIKKWNKREEELQEALLSKDIQQLDSLSPFEFEEWVARFLRIAGYKAEATKKSGDYGIDVIAHKDYIKLGVQVKKFTKPVGIKAVQEVISGMHYYNCNEGWVVTTAPYFTTAAINLAKTQNIKLYAKNDIALMLKNLQQDESLENEDMEIQYCNQCDYQLFPDDKICPNCKKKNIKNSDKANSEDEDDIIALHKIFDSQIADMVQIVTSEMLLDEHLKNSQDTIPYYKEIINQGKSIANKIFVKMTEENKKQPFDNFCVILLKCMIFMGMGAIYLYHKSNKDNLGDIYNRLIKPRGFLRFDDYVLDLYKMPHSSPKGLTFCNDLINYSTQILNEYVANITDEKEELIMITKCMLAMYLVGIIYGDNELS